MTKSNFQLILNQAFYAYQAGNLIEAERLYSIVLESYPRNAEINNDLGLVQKSLGKLEEAELSFRKTIEFKPDFVEGHNNLGNTLKDFRKLGKLEEAIKAYKNSIKLKPNYAVAHNNLGVALQIIGKFDEAEQCFKKAIEFKPDFAGAYLNYGSLLNVSKKFNESIIFSKKAIELNSNLHLAYFNLGKALFNQGKFDEATENYLKVINYNSDFAEFYNKLLKSPKKKSKLIDMELSIAQTLKLQSGLKESIQAKGIVSFIRKNFESALIDFDLCNTEQTRAHALMALYHLGDIDEIYQRIEKNLELDKKNISVSAFASFIAQKETLPLPSNAPFKPF